MAKREVVGAWSLCSPTRIAFSAGLLSVAPARVSGRAQTSGLAPGEHIDSKVQIFQLKKSICTLCSECLSSGFWVTKATCASKSRVSDL